MKNLILLTILTLAVLVFAGCPANETSNTETTKETNTETKDNSADSGDTKETADKKDDDSGMSDEDAEKMMNEDISDIDTSSPMKAEEVNSKFKSNEAELKDKKIAVTGKSSSYSTSFSTFNKDKSAWRMEVVGDTKKNGVVCVTKEKPKEAVDKITKKEMGQTAYLTVKGVVRKMVDGMISTRHVALEPCEVVKVEVK